MNHWRLSDRTIVETTAERWHMPWCNRLVYNKYVAKLRRKIFMGHEIWTAVLIRQLSLGIVCIIIQQVFENILAPKHAMYLALNRIKQSDMHFSHVWATGCLLCVVDNIAWWRHQMETASALLVLCEEKSAGGFPSQWPSNADVSLNKQWSRWWFETSGWSLWRHWNGTCSKEATLYQ